MIHTLEEEIDALHVMQKYPKKLYYIGNVSLLEKPKVAIVGSRKPNQYARSITAKISSTLAQHGVVVVSGGAMGIDAVAHRSSGAKNSIMVAGTGLDTRYPAVNKHLIAEIEQEGLVLSQFEQGSVSRAYHFPLRNELIVALSDVLVVTYAELKSGSMHSVKYALEMGKKIYVLPHRLGESEGTNKLLQEKHAEAIYDVEAWCSEISGKEKDVSLPMTDSFLEFCRDNPSYDTAVKYNAQKVFEYELQGKIKVVDGQIYLST